MKAKVKANHLTTEYRFTSNSSPLRTVVTGKGASFKPVLAPTLRRIAEGKPLCCTEGHSLKRFGYKNRYDRCAVCKKSGVDYHCERMYAVSYVALPQVHGPRPLLKNHREDQIKDAEDPEARDLLLCQPGSSLSLMLPADAVKDDAPIGGGGGGGDKENEDDDGAMLLCQPVASGASEGAGASSAAAASEGSDGTVSGSSGSSGEGGSGSGGAGVFDDLDAAAALGGVRLGLSFTLSLEVMLPLLPPAGQKLALLRLAPPPPQTGRAAKKQQVASLYVTGSGFVGGVDVLKAEAKWKKRLEEEETKGGSTSSKNSSPSKALRDGDKVEVDYKGKGRYYPGSSKWPNSTARSTSTTVTGTRKPTSPSRGSDYGPLCPRGARIR